MGDCAICWFRRDLRLHDNEALRRAAGAETLVPLYVVDPREYGPREFGGRDSFRFEQTGGHRARFRVESLADLRDRLRARGSDLVVRVGRPESVVPDLASRVGADRVTVHTVPTPEERGVETGVRARLAERGVAVSRAWGHTLHHPADLPTPYTDISDTYTTFRKAVEADERIRPARSVPSLPAFPDVDVGTVPRLADLGVDDAPADGRAVLPFRGGETAGLDRLDAYVWERDRLREYRETRNGLLGPDYSSKLSAWLNEGCLSPRRVYEEVERYERERVENDSTYWLVFELRWRDFFAFQVAKHGARLFDRGGIRERDVAWREDRADFERWCRAETGVPFVDANLRELRATGYLSNRGRQNVASFLANDLRVDWRWGAAFFETHLVDYDPASNYGNWAYVAGVGNDSRDRSFDVLSQADRYDPDAAYVSHWLPALADLPPEDAHRPWRLSAGEAAAYDLELGVDYPRPMITLDSSG